MFASSLIAALLVFIAACSGSSESETIGPETTVPTGPVSTPSPTPVTPSTVVSSDTPLPIGTVVINEVTISVEVSADPVSRLTGLSGRESLPSGSGMLFAWLSGEATSFWMADMLFPLDIIWIGPDCRVVDINHNVPIPETGTSKVDLPSYSSAQAASYVLEINAGRSRALGIETGDLVRFIDMTASEAQSCT